MGIDKIALERLESIYNGDRSFNIRKNNKALFESTESFDDIYENELKKLLSKRAISGVHDNVNKLKESIAEFDLTHEFSPTTRNNVRLFSNKIFYFFISLSDFDCELKPSIFEENIEIFSEDIKKIGKEYDIDNQSTLDSLTKINNEYKKFFDDKSIENIVSDCRYLIQFVNQNLEDLSIHRQILRITNNFTDGIDHILNIKGIKTSIKDASSAIKNFMDLASKQGIDLKSQAINLKDIIKNHTTDNSVLPIQNDNILFSVDIDNNKYQSFHYFKDTSIMVVDHKGEITTPETLLEVKKIISSITDSFIYKQLDKHPMIAKLFIEANRNEMNILATLPCIDTYKNNVEVLKASGFNFQRELEEASDLEEFDDTMNEAIKKHQVYTYAHSISSKKYEYLYDSESYKIFEELKQMGVSVSDLQGFIGKKIAAFTDSQEFNLALRSLLGQEFNIERYMELAKQANIEIVSKKDNVLILDIQSFEQSKLLGSTSWCISRDEYYFDSYKGEQDKQLFMYDFNRSTTDKDSMIGLTLNREGKVTAAHLKDDTSMKEDTAKIKAILGMIPEKPLKNKKITRKEIGQYQ